MSTRTDYTDAQWNTLIKAPAMAGLAVVSADPSGPIGVFKELNSMGRWILGAAENAPEGSLLAELVADVRAIAERKRPAPEEERIPADHFKPRMLGTLREAVGILAARANPVETEAYKQWVVDVATNIARAAKEGTVLGFGGTPVSDAERAIVREIVDALGTTAPAL